MTVLCHSQTGSCSADAVIRSQSDYTVSNCSSVKSSSKPKVTAEAVLTHLILPRCLSCSHDNTRFTPWEWRHEARGLQYYAQSSSFAGATAECATSTTTRMGIFWSGETLFGRGQRGWSPGCWSPYPFIPTKRCGLISQRDEWTPNRRP
jgi:hypothetical protein